MMTERATLPTPPRQTPPGRPLRARWRAAMILGLNALVALVALSATLILALEQRQAVQRLHEAAAAQVLALAEVTRAPDGSPTLSADALDAALAGTGYAYVLDADGTLWAVGSVTPNPDRTPASFKVFTETRAGGSAMRIYRGLGDQWVIGRGERAPDGTYTVITETPLREYGTVAVRVLALWALALVITAVIGEALIDRILRTVLGPLERLRAGADAISQGDYTYRVRLPAHTERELAQLGDAFNLMVHHLHAGQQQIDAYTHHMEEIVDLRARELARKARQLELAADVSSTIATILDPRELVEEVVPLIREQFRLYHVSVLLVGETDGTLRPGGRVLPGTLPAPVPVLSLRDDTRSVVAAAARSSTTIYVPDVTQEPRYHPLPDYPASQSELAIPLQYHNRVIGVLNLEADHRDAFRPDDIAVLETLAHEIAGAMHNAQTFAKLEAANRDLAQASLQARQANVLKSRFLLNASHKLRTPLNAIIGYSETILSGVYGEIMPQVADRQRRILENGRILQALIEDMLDLSSIETGELQLQREWVALAPLLEEVLNAARALHQTAYSDHDLALRLDLAHRRTPLPLVWVDVERLRYILMSLLSNAIKFTPAGAVTLSADTEPHAAPERMVIAVSDTGPGISAEEQGHLFDAFQHPRGSTEGEGKGTGLALAVSRLLAMQHGGDLLVESAVHEGSRFMLHLPLHPDEAPPPPGG